MTINANPYLNVALCMDIHYWTPRDGRYESFYIKQTTVDKLT